MEIKQFREMSTLEKEELYNFIKSIDLTYNKNYSEMVRTYESDVFNGGNNVLILFANDEIKGSMAVITKEIAIKGEAFITDIVIGNENLERNLGILIEKIIVECSKQNANSIKVGLRKEETQLIPFINKLEFNHTYDAVVMKFTGTKEKRLGSNENIELVPLSILNSKQYMNIQNEAFKDSPNGGTIDELEVMDYIVRYANNEDLVGLCYFEKKPCGMYELSLYEDIGWIDTLAISTEYQNKGIGRLLLSSCIEKLWGKGAQEIKLLVINANDIAVKMYERNGFEEEKVFSHWFEKTLKDI